MRAHQNTILAMKISTLLMSVSAVVLVIMLLTSNAVAKQNSDLAKPQEVISDIAPVEAAPIIDTAPPPVTPRTRLVIMRVIAVTATPDTSAATNALRLAMQGRSAIPTGDQPVAEAAAQDTSAAAAWTGSSDLPAAPVVSDVNAPVVATPAAAPAAPAAGVAAPAAAPAQNNSGGQTSAPKPAPAPAPAPKPAPAPAPAPKPAPPPVKTKTS